VLKPASYHVMLMDAQKLAPGTSVKVTLKFEKAGSITIDVPVREP
jgi:copper(I)-binding protein